MMANPRGSLAKWLIGFAILLVGLALVAVLGLSWPVTIPPFPPAPEKPLGYEEASQAAMAWADSEPDDIKTVCRTVALLHGRRTPRVFLLLHGLSNCPAQYAQLAAQLHARGHNVFVPRLPRHGNKNRLTPDYKLLNLEEVALWGGRALDTARGLGDELVVFGLSVNGTTAAWMAQERGDINRTVIASPFLKPTTPKWLAPFIGKIFLRLPNRFVWWDRKLREDLPGPTHAYPGFPTHVVGEFIALGDWVIAEAGKEPPACPRIAMVLSEDDRAISLPAASLLAANWSRWPEVTLEKTVFPLADAVPHDMIDPDQPDARTEIVYPRLIEILEAP